MSRTHKALKNISYGLGSKLLLFALQFISRTVFIYQLGETYLGINGLYSEILTVLSFAELGFGSAMSYALYKPIADGDFEKTSQLMRFFKKVYRLIAIAVAVCGMVIFPFLQYLVKGAEWVGLDNLRVYYLLFLANSVVGYFVVYKYNYLNAMQDGYIPTKLETMTAFTCGVFQIAALLLFKSFLAYLLVNTGVLISTRILISFYLNKQYKELKQKPSSELPKVDKRIIYKDVKGLCINQFASVAVNGTDNVIISTLCKDGIISVGIISNYKLILNAVMQLIRSVFINFVPTFGNIAASSGDESFYKAFKEIDFLNYWIYSVASTCLFVLIPSFIALWIGDEYKLDMITYSLIMIDFYMMGQQSSYGNARAAKGHFDIDKWWTVGQAVSNLVISIFGAIFLGLPGVFMGTVLSRLFYTIGRPISTYRFLFNRSCSEYFKVYFCRFIVTVISTLLVWAILNIFFNDCSSSIVYFVIASIVSFLIANFMLFLVFHKSEEYGIAVNRVKYILRRAK